MSFLERRQLLALLLYVRRRRRQKDFWVHPLISERYLTGSFYINHNKLRQDERLFFNYYRMSTATYEFLLYRLSVWIKKQDTKFRLCVPPNEMLAVTLRYLASGNTFTDMFYKYHLGIKTISEIISLVCCTIWDELSSEFLAPPNTDKWKSVAREFQARANFPNCLGAVDGKHIRIENFPSAGSMNYNYKGYYSIVLLAVTDSKYKFLFVDIGAYGKDCDSAILQRTTFHQLLTEGRLQVPDPTPLHPSLNNRMPYVLVGDEAFQLNNSLLRPYGGKNLDVKKRIFNYRLSRARRYVECTFGILANKWRILHRPLNVSKQLSKDIVKACVVLHNIVCERDGYTQKDMFVHVNHNGFQDVPIATNNAQAGRTANDIRNNFADFFSSPAGSVPWQMSKI